MFVRKKPARGRVHDNHARSAARQVVKPLSKCASFERPISPTHTLTTLNDGPPDSYHPHSPPNPQEPGAGGHRRTYRGGRMEFKTSSMWPPAPPRESPFPAPPSPTSSGASNCTSVSGAPSAVAGDGASGAAMLLAPTAHTLALPSTAGRNLFFRVSFFLVARARVSSAQVFSACPRPNFPVAGGVLPLRCGNFLVFACFHLFRSPHAGVARLCHLELLLESSATVARLRRCPRCCFVVGLSATQF